MLLWPLCYSLCLEVKEYCSRKYGFFHIYIDSEYWNVAILIFHGIETLSGIPHKNMLILHRNFRLQ